MAQPRQKKPPLHPKVAAWTQAIFRASKAKSQEAAAEMIGVSRSGFAKWYYGTQKPQLDESQKLEAAAKKFGVATFADFGTYRAGEAQPTEFVGVREEVSDYPAKTLPPGLGGFLERYDRRLTEDEKHELRTRGAEFMLARGEPDDAYWWALVQLWRKYDPGPSGGLG